MTHKLGATTDLFAQAARRDAAAAVSVAASGRCLAVSPLVGVARAAGPIIRTIAIIG